MTDFANADVQELLTQPNYAVISTNNADGTISSSVVWMAPEGETLTVNSAKGRKWPTNLDRDPNTTVVVIASDNPYFFVEVRGTADGTTEGADEHINGLTKKYIGQDEYPFRQPGEQRVKYTITPTHVRLIKQ